MSPMLVPQGVSNLPFTKECPLCHKETTAEAVTSLKSRDSVHLIHVLCVHCKNAVLAVVTVSQLGMSSVGLYTDLSAKDAATFVNADAITDDDVLAWHEELKLSAPEFSQQLVAFGNEAKRNTVVPIHK